MPAAAWRMARRCRHARRSRHGWQRSGATSCTSITSGYDNFFSLGGDSILAIQVNSKAQQAGLSISVRQIFEQQTIASLARVAESASRPGGARSGEWPCSADADSALVFGQSAADPHHFNQAVLLEVGAGIDLDALRRAVQQLVQHHDALRLRFAGGSTAPQPSCLDHDESVTVTARDLSKLRAASGRAR